MCSIVSFVVGLGFLAESVFGSGSIGLYRLKCNEIKNCDGEESSGYTIRYKKMIGCSDIPDPCSGEIALNYDFDQNISGTYTVYILEKGTWYLHRSTDFTDGCQTMMELLPELFSLFRLSVRCPVLNGTYEFQESDINGARLLRFPVLPYRNFRLKVNLYQSKHSIKFCLLFDINAVPRTSR